MIKLTRRLTIRNKLTLLLLLVSLTTLVVATLLSIRTIYQSRRVNVTELLNQLNQHLAQRIDKFINDKIETFRINIVDPGISRVTKEQGSFIAKSLLAEDKSIFEVSFLDPSGQEIVKLSPERTWRDEELVNQNAQQKFQVPINKQEYISEVYATPAGLALTLAAPVVNQEGTVIAVLTGEVLLTPVKETIEQVKLGKQGYFALVNKRDGKLLYASKSEVAKQSASFAADPVVTKIVSGQQQVSPTRSYRSPSGQKVIGAGQSLDALPWVALSQWPTGDAFAVVWSLVLQVLAILVILAGLLVVIARLIARQVVRPIETLKEGTERVGKGEFGYQIAVATGDEIEDLAQNFNFMSGHLKETVGKLVEEQKKVAKAKDEFVFIAAHELRSPVTVIKGYLELITMQAKKLGKEVTDSIDQIKGANDRLLGLVQDLLEVARSDAGTLKIEVAPVENLQQVTDEIVQQYQEKARQSKVTLKYAKPEKLPAVVTDANRFKQVLGNLVDNAIKYNRSGGTVNVNQEVKDGRLQTIVADTGFGMSSESLKKLFSKFFRAQEKGTEKVTGTGLGLWITKELIERMGGTINVTSTLDKGSTFNFALPLAKAGK